MLRLLLVLFCFLYSTAHAQTPIALSEGEERLVFTNDVLILEDADHQYTIEQVLTDESLPFNAMKTDNLDFTASVFWVKFKVINSGNELQRLVFETGRPITNKVVLYSISDGQILRTQKSGDDFAFSEKTTLHRKNRFPIEVLPQQTSEYVLMMESDGELLSAPMVLYTESGVFDRDYGEQYLLGFYYGLLLFVVLIYSFFYSLLKEKSFLFYVAYVFSLGLLQFSLDGYSFQYLFPSGGFMANQIVLLSAGMGVIFVLLYARSYVKMHEILPKMNKGFTFMVWGLIAISTLSCIPGPTYLFSFPVINVFSLIATIMIPVSIFIAIRKGHHVDRFFTTAFVILIISAVVFILRNLSVVPDNLFTEHALKFGSGIEVIFLSFSMANRYRYLQQEKETAQAKVLEQREEKIRLMDGINERLEKEVQERTAEINEQKEQLSEQNKDILDSIRYAQRIQNAILPSDATVKELIPDSFIFYRPRDIVSGDFYWVAEVNPEDGNPLTIFAAADCTGHGVPGAFVSILGANFLKLGQTTTSVNTPAEALDFLSQGINTSLNQRADETTVRDGMDIALCALDKFNHKLHFAGAKNPVYVVRKGTYSEEQQGKHDVSERQSDLIIGDYKLMEFKGDRQAIGAMEGEKKVPFTNQTIDLEPGDTIYVFSDGYADQFGGKRGKKFMYKRFKELLLSVQSKSMNEQKEVLEQTILAWMNVENQFGETCEQLDDILVIGVQV